MEIYYRVIKLVDFNLIHCLIPIILTLIIVKTLFKNRFETKKVLNLCRWLIIVYTIVTFTVYLVEMILEPNQHAFIKRATGPYAWPYWMMLLSAIILPLTLFSKKLVTKFWYVILVAFGMKIGMFFERFVIILTSYHRDYLGNNGNFELMGTFYFGIGIIVLQGVFIAILLLGIFEIKKSALQ